MTKSKTEELREWLAETLYGDVEGQLPEPGWKYAHRICKDHFYGKANHILKACQDAGLVFEAGQFSHMGVKWHRIEEIKL